MNIVEALEALAVEGMEGGHDHVIETVLSKLFIRGDHVHKAYKHRTADFADLADRETRRSYIGEDFFWNNVMAPDIYLELRPVRRDGMGYVHVGDEHAEDWYLLMKKIDTSRDLMRMLEQDPPTQEALRGYVRTLLSRLSGLTAARRDELVDFFERGAAHVRDEVLGTVGWAYTADPHLSKEDVARAEKALRRATETHSYFQSPVETLSVVIDVNGENVLFLENGVSFIDVMPPKDAWRVHDTYFIVARTSADISALHDPAHAEVLHNEYAQIHSSPGDAVRAVYEIAAALIQVPYRKMVGRPDLSEKYAEFVRRRTRELELLLEDA